MDLQQQNVYTFTDVGDNNVEQYCTYPPDKIAEGENPALVIDNGSFQFRAGWENDDAPRLVFKNAMAKNRATKKDRDWEMQVGNDIKDFEAVRWMIRTPFDMDVVVNFSAQETVFDHAFEHLGINTDGCVDHPVVLTEPIANPVACRNKMVELLFEGYDIPKITFGIDSLFSLYNNQESIESQTSLIISSSFQVTHVIPVVNGKVDKENSRRLNLGGYNNCAYLSRLMQLKYPKHASLFSLSRMEEYLQTQTVLPINYHDGIKKWTTSDYALKNKTYIRDSKSSFDDSNNNENLTNYIETSKVLRRYEYQLYRLEYMLEIEKVDPSLFANMLEQANLESVENLKEEIKKFQLRYDSVHTEIIKVKSVSDKPHICFEDAQAVEILFQPSLVGFEQSGLPEIIENVLMQFSSNIQSELTKNIFITGGNTSYPGFLERINNEIVKIRPFNSTVNVTQADDVVLDSWNGERKWTEDNHYNTDAWISKQDYAENGKEMCLLKHAVFDKE